MKPLLFHTLWGWRESLAAASAYASASDFDGLEVNLHHPALEACSREQVRELLDEAEQKLIIEITTGGGYVPVLDAAIETHLNEIARGLEMACRLLPVRINLITGSDSWGLDQQHQFLEEAIKLSTEASCPVSFETHRSRSLFNPWWIVDYLKAHPKLRLTADLSHWCVVSERLMTPELEPIKAMAPHVDHIHARIGHDQGASVSDPFVEMWQQERDAHLSCWRLFASQRTRHGPLTMTPEFGPDGYMPVDPDHGQPLRPVQQINHRMAAWLRNTASP